ncbi:hypothetical protein D3C76_1349730 [compost metagenome]
MRHHIFKERHYQLGRRGVFTHQIERKRDAKRNHRHPEILPAGDEPFSVFTHHFAVVIDKTDDAIAHQHNQYAPDIRV